MKKLLFILFMAIITLTSCDSIDIAKGTPRCVVEKINNSNYMSTCSNANVKEYTFQEKTVFVFDPGNCGADMTSEVIDSDCNTLGYLGGIIGNTKINEEEFSNAIYIKTIWEKQKISLQ